MLNTNAHLQNCFKTVLKLEVKLSGVEVHK